MSRQRQAAARFWRAGLASFLAGQIVMGSSAPAWAQRRRDEPMANPQFQQDVGKTAAGAGGGPIEGPPAEAPARALAEPSDRSEPESAPRPSGVQIGVAAPRPAAAP